MKVKVLQDFAIGTGPLDGSHKKGDTPDVESGPALKQFLKDNPTLVEAIKSESGNNRNTGRP